MQGAGERGAGLVCAPKVQHKGHHAAAEARSLAPTATAATVVVSLRSIRARRRGCERGLHPRMMRTAVRAALFLCIIVSGEAWLSVLTSFGHPSALAQRRARGVPPLAHSQWRKWREWRKKSSWEWMDDWAPMSIGEIPERNGTKIIYDREKKTLTDRAREIGGGEFL